MTSAESTTGGVADAGVGLTPRAGSRPRTNTPNIPHQQLDQFPCSATAALRCARRVFDLPGVEERPSVISVPGARALWLAADQPAGPAEAFMAGREFAHFHPDHSLHICLPTHEAEQAIAAGWGEWHPWVEEGRVPRNVVMVFAPRDTGEADVVEFLVGRSHRFATSDAPQQTGNSREQEHR